MRQQELDIKELTRPDGLVADPERSYLFGLTVACLTRASDDPYWLEKSVRTQEDDTSALAWAAGAQRAWLYRENDTSAFKQRRVRQVDSEGNPYWILRVIRPVWERLLTDIRAGRIQAIVVVDLDRMTRDNRTLEDAIEVATLYGCIFRSITTGKMDLNSADGRTMARVMVAMANKASEDTSRRSKRGWTAARVTGKPGGGPRPFGWQNDRVTLNLDEAEEVRKAAARLTAGVSVFAVLSDWNSRGVKTSRGNEWTWTSFLTYFRNPRLCGLRVKHFQQERPDRSMYAAKEIVRKPDGTEVIGTWTPILSREAWEAVMSVVGDGGAPEKKTHTGRIHLLSGILKCGTCGSSMNGVPGTGRTAEPNKSRGYRCSGTHCHTRRQAEPIDQMITELAFRLHDSATAAYLVGDVEAEVWEGEDQLKAIEKRLEEALAAWKSGMLDGNGYFPLRRDLEADRTKLLRAKSRFDASKGGREVVADIRDRWEDVSIGERAAFISRYISHVVAHPLPKVRDEATGREFVQKRFNPDLIEPFRR